MDLLNEPGPKPGLAVVAAVAQERGAYSPEKSILVSGCLNVVFPRERYEAVSLHCSWWQVDEVPCSPAGLQSWTWSALFSVTFRAI